MNWYKIVKLSSSYLGEYWITDAGQALYADGDIGDMNHEGYVMETLRSQACNCDDFESWKEEQAKELADQIKIDNPKIDQYDLEDMIEEGIIKMIHENGLTNEDINIMNGKGDVRLYAIKNWMWKRLQGNNIEVWDINKNTLKSIADGLYDAYQEFAEQIKYNIDVRSTRSYFQNVPYIVIASGNIRGLREYGERY